MALAVLAMLASITVPPMLRLYRQTQITESAEDVRAQIAGTRARAIESGLIYQFRFEPEGRGYLAVPFEREIDQVSAANIGTGGSTAVGQYSKFAGELPEGLKFAKEQAVAGAVTQKLSEDVLQGLPNVAQLASRSWSGPLLFLPTGSASNDASLELVDGNNHAIRLDIRGLTGGVTVGRVTGGGS